MEFNEDGPDQFKFDWDDPEGTQNIFQQREPAIAEDNLPQRDPLQVNPPQRKPTVVSEAPQGGRQFQKTSETVPNLQCCP